MMSKTHASRNHRAIVGSVATVTSVLSTGILFGTVASLSRAKYKFESPVYVTVQQATIHALRPIMSVLLPASTLSNLVVLVHILAQSGSAPKRAWLGAGGPMATVVLTICFELPLNNQVVDWDPTDVPPDWTKVRNRWESIHIFRTALALVGLAGTLSVGRPAAERKQIGLPVVGVS